MINLKKLFFRHVGIIFLSCSLYFFLVPNHFVTGGVTGLSTILNALVPQISTATFLMGLNLVMLSLGFIFLGRSTGIWTVYCSLAYSGLMMLFENLDLISYLAPGSKTLTTEPFLELCVGIVLYAIGSALIFYTGASSGGMDIVALIIQKYAKLDVGKAVLYVNMFIAVGSIFVFRNVLTAILSLLGLFANAFIIDIVIDNLDSCKYFIVITDKPELVSEYIMNTLHHGVTVTDAIGAYTQTQKGMIHTVCRRYEAIRLRQAIKKIDENAFIVVTTSSEIIGKGFRSV